MVHGFLHGCTVLGRRARAAHRRESAQGLLEFALIAPVVLLMFLGVVDFSRFLYFNQAITSAARAGGDMAINHCAYHVSCGKVDTVVGDDYIVQAVYCDAAPHIPLQPQPSTCASCLTATCTSPTPICDSSCLSELCVQDICTSPTASTRTNGQDVTVSVGYSWKPITPMVSGFFPDRSCWQGDPSSNHHTLCASATGSVY